jgi:hypothetical protein
VSAINEFPWQETILRELSDGSTSTIDELAEAIERESGGDGVREGVESDVHHMTAIGLARLDGDRVGLTGEGMAAARRLP